MTLLVMVNNGVIVFSEQPEVERKTLCYRLSHQPIYARFI